MFSPLSSSFLLHFSFSLFSFFLVSIISYKIAKWIERKRLSFKEKSINCWNCNILSNNIHSRMSLFCEREQWRPFCPAAQQNGFYSPTGKLHFVSHFLSQQSHEHNKNKLCHSQTFLSPSLLKFIIFTLLRNSFRQKMTSKLLTKRLYFSANGVIQWFH